MKAKGDAMAVSDGVKMEMIVIQNDCTSTAWERDKTESALNEIARYKLQKVRGSITLHFDGSGVIAKYTCTYEGK